MKLQVPKILADGSWSAVATIGDRVGFFVAFVLLARTSAMETNGAIVSAFAFCTIFSLLFDFGYPAYLQRLAASRPQELELETGAILWVKAIQALPFAVVGSWFLLGGNLHTVDVVFLIAATYSFSVATALTGILWGLGHYRQAATTIAYSRLVLLASIPLHTITSDPFYNTLTPVLLSSLVQVGVVSARIPFRLRPIRPSRNLLRSILRSSLPIGIGIFFVSVYDRVDVLLIQKLLGPQSVSLYAAAYALYRIPSVFDSFFLVPAFSSMSEDYGQTGVLARRRWLMLFVAILGFALAGILLFSVLADWLCATVYGSRFAASADALKLLGFALPGLLLNRFTGISLNAVHKEFVPLLATTAGVAVNVTANLLLLPHWSFIGAVWATIIAEYTVLAIESAALFRARAIR